MKTMQFTHDTVRFMGVHVLAVYMLLRCAEEEKLVPVQAQWILDHMPDKTSPNTVTAALRWLTSPERQIAIRVIGGWRLNGENAFQLPLTYNLPEGDREPGIAQSAILVHTRESNPEPGIAQSAILVTISDENRAERDSAFAYPKLEEDSINSLSLIDIDSSSSSKSENRAERGFHSEGENPPLEEGFPTVLEILAASADLFGKPGVVATKLDVHALYAPDVFAWIACAYDQWVDGGRKGKLHSPSSYVYKKLELTPFEKPSIEYEQGWRQYLPTDWLEQFGLMEYCCDVCGEVRKLRAEFERHMETHPKCKKCDERFLNANELEEHSKKHAPLVQSESVHQRTSNDGMSPEIAWQSVLGQLQMEMPRASFDTWARDTTALDFDGKTLTIGVRNAYARDWLESRLASTVSRLLVGIMRQAVDVNFVTATLDESENE